jgi:hypothetical protein
MAPTDQLQEVKIMLHGTAASEKRIDENGLDTLKSLRHLIAHFFNSKH